MGELSSWAQKNSPFLKIPDNESVEVMYLGFKEVDDNRNPGKTKMRYEVELDGSKKWFESASGSVAMTFDMISEGEMVKITKAIVGDKPKYTVEQLTKTAVVGASQEATEKK